MFLTEPSIPKDKSQSILHNVLRLAGELLETSLREFSPFPNLLLNSHVQFSFILELYLSCQYVHLGNDSLALSPETMALPTVDLYSQACPTLDLKLNSRNLCPSTGYPGLCFPGGVLHNDFDPFGHDRLWAQCDHVTTMHSALTYS